MPDCENEYAFTFDFKNKFIGMPYDKEFELLWQQIGEELRAKHSRFLDMPYDSGFERMWRQIRLELKSDQEVTNFALRFQRKLTISTLQR
ncbi:uncharacterized protein LOC6495869 [Drosophila ananassae]|uniref:uncharacterized protein LOC6495869 n=1 Tax=Drosophila ananassae TaxID=7217 RepID=UPI000177D04E|nr:uncharacterized protein LOC6495869 [Drosophila ananassae]